MFVQEREFIHLVDVVSSKSHIKRYAQNISEHTKIFVTYETKGKRNRAKMHDLPQTRRFSFLLSADKKKKKCERILFNSKILEMYKFNMSQCPFDCFI